MWLNWDMLEPMTERLRGDPGKSEEGGKLEFF